MHATCAKLVPTWRTRQAVGEMTVFGFVGVMSYGTGQWCWRALGAVMTFRTSVACHPSIVWCGWPGPWEAVVSRTTLAWCNTLPGGRTEGALFKRKKRVKMSGKLSWITLQNRKCRTNTVYCMNPSWDTVFILLFFCFTVKVVLNPGSTT